MGAANENEAQKYSFQIQIEKIWLSISFQENVITIKGYTSIRKTSQYQIYNASYDAQSLPQDIYDYFGSIQNLMRKIQKNKEKLRIANQSDLIISIKQNVFRLALLTNGNQNQITLQKENFHPVKPVNQQKILQLPYAATVLIISNSPTCQFKGSGAIVGKSIVLTVAHIVYDRHTKTQATKSSVWVQTKNGLQQIKVKKIYFPPQYKSICQQDVHKYDFAHLQLEENEIVNMNNILPIKWNYKEPQKDFQVMGFSRKLDVQFNVKQNSVFHLRCNRTIKLLQNFITYDNKAEGGISGGPIVSLQNNVYYLIGLHQGMLINFSRGVLLTSYGKNPYQILSSFSNHYALALQSSQSSLSMQQQISSKQKQKEQQILKLKQQIQKIKKQKDKQETEKLKLKQQNQNIKKQLQQKIQITKNIDIAMDYQSKKSQSKNLISSQKIQVNQGQKDHQNVDLKKIENQKKQLLQFDIGGFFYSQIISFQKKTTKIYLSQCNLADSSLQKITQKLEFLEEIKIYDCQYLKFLKFKNLSKVKKIEISNINITQIKLKNLPKLQKIAFDGCNQLQYVTIVNCQILKNVDLSSVVQLYGLHLQNSPELKSLIFKNCLNLYKCKSINCKQLKILNLEGAQLSKIKLQILLGSLQIQQINLRKCLIKKNIQLFNCNIVKKIILSQTSINDSKLDHLIKQLPNLEDLDLYKCQQLKNLNILGSCKQLKVLNLDQTSISDALINDFITKMPKLVNLQLGNYDKKQIIKFSACKQLLILDVPAYKLTEVQFKQLSELKMLKQLYLQGNNTLQGLKFDNLKQLRKLSLSNNTKIKDDKLKQICNNNNCQLLLQLNLSGCKGLQKVSLQNLKKLKILNIKETNITELNLNDQTDLEELDIQNCYRLKLLSLQKCKKIFKLNISNYLNSSIQLENLINSISSLRQLNLYHFDNKPNKTYPKLQCKKLNKLTLKGCATQISINSTLQFLKQQTLQYLCLSNCQYFAKIQFINCKKLKYLNLEWTNIADLSEKVTAQFYELEELNLFKCQKLTTIKFKNSLKLKKINLGCVPLEPNSLQELSKDLQSLEDLNLYKYPSINICSINHGKQIKKLNLSYSSIKSSQLNRIVKQLRHLQQIYLNGCKQLTHVKFNQEQCPKLNKISLDFNKLNQIKLQGKSYLKELNIQSSDINKITISNCKIFSKIHLQLVYDLSVMFLDRLPKLEQFYISLNWIPTITFQNWSSVKKLSFICSSIKNVQLTQHLKKCQNLKYLNLSNSNALTGVELNLCKNLENVVLYYTSIPKQKIQQMKKNFPQIQFQTSS